MKVAPGCSNLVAPGIGNVKLGLDGLTEDISLNSSTVTPDFIYRGKGATTAALPAHVGTDLAIAGSGSDITANQDALIINGTGQSFKLNDGKYFESPNNTFADIANEDFVIEAVINYQSNSNGHYLSKGGYSTTLSFWGMYSENATTMRLSISDGALGNSATVNVTGLSVGTWYHVMAFIDRSGSVAVYVNGVLTGSPADCSAVTSLSRADRFRVGRRESGTEGTGYIAWLAQWKQNAWLGTHLNGDIAAARYSQVFGV